MKYCVTGAGGFIGSHLVKSLLEEGLDVRACDIKPFMDWHQKFPGAENLRLDLRDPLACRVACARADHVFNLACDMGGIGHIETHKADCITSVLINTNMLISARNLGVKRYFYSSSACVYNGEKQNDSNAQPLKESDAYPALPERGYGTEKLFSEEVCICFNEDYGIETRIARYHNCYGPNGTWKGGREKAPAAICRKVIESKLSGRNEIEIWGDGNQSRTFMFISDCIKGTRIIMDGYYGEPINLGSSELVSINQLVDIVEEIAGVKLKRNYNLEAPLGVRGRSSDNHLIKKLFDWEPSTPLREGMAKLYEWIHDQIVGDHLRSAI
jgi:nucleoside-diphosphate-sugar epimerase